MNRKTRAARRWLAALYLPWLAMAAVPTYNQVEPRLGGMPFFYWYQLLWIVGGGVVTFVVLLGTESFFANQDARADRFMPVVPYTHSSCDSHDGLAACAALHVEACDVEASL